MLIKPPSQQFQALGAVTFTLAHLVPSKSDPSSHLPGWICGCCLNYPSTHPTPSATGTLLAC